MGAAGPATAGPATAAWGASSEGGSALGCGGRGCGCDSSGGGWDSGLRDCGSGVRCSPPGGGGSGGGGSCAGVGTSAGVGSGEVPAPAPEDDAVAADCDVPRRSSSPPQDSSRKARGTTPMRRAARIHTSISTPFAHGNSWNRGGRAVDRYLCPPRRSVIPRRSSIGPRRPSEPDTSARETSTSACGTRRLRWATASSYMPTGRGFSKYRRSSGAASMLTRQHRLHDAQRSRQARRRPPLTSSTGPAAMLPRSSRDRAIRRDQRGPADDAHSNPPKPLSRPQADAGKAARNALGRRRPAVRRRPPRREHPSHGAVDAPADGPAGEHAAPAETERDGVLESPHVRAVVTRCLLGLPRRFPRSQ